MYSPVVNRASLMTVMALAVMHKMYFCICDVKGAFLYVDVYDDENVVQVRYERPTASSTKLDRRGLLQSN